MEDVEVREEESPSLSLSLDDHARVALIIYETPELP